MFLDIGGDGALLPGGEPAAHMRVDGGRPGVEAHELVRQDDAEGSEIGAAVGAGMLDQPHELACRVRQCRVLEEQPRGQRAGRGDRAESRRHAGRIEIEVDEARQKARLLPFMVLVAGRHQGQLAPRVAQPRSRQAFDEGVAIAAHALIADGEKMKRGAKANFQLLAPRRLHDLGGDAAPADGAALHDIGRIDLHRLAGRIDQWADRAADGRAAAASASSHRTDYATPQSYAGNSPA